MREGQTRLSLERANSDTLEAACLISLREDFRVTKIYAKPTIVTVGRCPGLEPMESDIIESSVADDVRRTTRVMFSPGDKWFAFVVEIQDIARLIVARQR